MGRLPHQMRHIAPDAVVGHSPVDGYAGAGDVGEFDGVVGFGEDGFRQVFADLVLIDVKGGHHFDVFDAVVADAGVHQAGDGFVFRHFDIFVQPLNQGGGTIADADDGDLDFTH